jgi:hypothetical protein
MAERFSTYAEFWPHYLREHARPATRVVHFAGTAAGVVVLVVGVAAGIWWLVPLALVAGYGPAWIAHGTVERNRPATFDHPVWSFVSDFRMLGLWLAGRLAPELRRAGVDRPGQTKTAAG